MRGVIESRARHPAGRDVGGDDCGNGAGCSRARPGLRSTIDDGRSTIVWHSAQVFDQSSRSSFASPRAPPIRRRCARAAWARGNSAECAANADRACRSARVLRDELAKRLRHQRVHVLRLVVRRDRVDQRIEKERMARRAVLLVRDRRHVVVSRALRADAAHGPGRRVARRALELCRRLSGRAGPPSCAPRG